MKKSECLPGADYRDCIIRMWPDVRPEFKTAYEHACNHIVNDFLAPKDKASHHRIIRYALGFSAKRRS